MNPGLRFLLGAAWRGFFRRAGRRLRTVRGALTAIFGLLFFLLLVGSQVVVLATPRGGEVPEHGHTVLVFSLAMTLLLGWSLVAADAPFFWPAEVQFLFPAPLARRELLLYQMLRSGGVQALSGLWIGLMTLRSARHPLASLSAGVLGVLFVYAVTQLAGLVKLAVTDRLPPRARTLLPTAAGALALAAAFAFYRRARAVGFGDAVGEAFASSWMRMVTLPARPFGEVFAARSWGEGAAWAALCGGLIVGAGAAAAACAPDFRERSLATSARRFQRLRRMRSARGGLGTAAGPARRRVPVPALAFLGPAAPLARRQAYELGRGLRALGGLLFTAGVAFFYVIVLPGWDAGPPRPLGATLVVLVVVYPVLASSGFSIDFRRDLERMAYLRSLPLAPRAVAVGQVFTSTAMITAVSGALLVAAAATSGWRVERPLALAAAAGAAPVAWLAVTLENWIFLLFPTRTQADGGQQNAFMGKQVLKLLFKTVALGLVAGAAGLSGAAGAWLAGAWGAAAGMAAIVLLACAGATALLARAYRGFDLTVDQPA